MGRGWAVHLTGEARRGRRPGPAASLWQEARRRRHHVRLSPEIDEIIYGGSLMIKLARQVSSSLSEEAVVMSRRAAASTYTILEHQLLRVPVDTFTSTWKANQVLPLACTRAGVQLRVTTTLSQCPSRMEGCNRRLVITAMPQA
eukprot:597143-Pleurochrysis_carterae.AAC.3